MHYILTGETKRDQLLAAVKASTEKMAGLALVSRYRGAIDQLLTGLYVENIDQIKEALENIGAGYVGLNGINKDKKCVADAISDYGKCELTTAERNLIAVYRKAVGQDKFFIDRLAQLVEKAVEAESGIAEGVIDGE